MCVARCLATVLSPPHRGRAAVMKSLSACCYFSRRVRTRTYLSRVIVTFSTVIVLIVVWFSPGFKPRLLHPCLFSGGLGVW